MSCCLVCLYVGPNLFLKSISTADKSNIIIDLAVKNMKLAVHGWMSESDYSVEEYLKILEANRSRDGKTPMGLSPPWVSG